MDGRTAHITLLPASFGCGVTALDLAGVAVLNIARKEQRAARAHTHTSLARVMLRRRPPLEKVREMWKKIPQTKVKSYPIA